MNDIYIHNYDKLYVADLTVRSNGGCNKDSQWEIRTRETINKMVCYADGFDVISSIAEKTHNPAISPNAKLFVASECKTSRDTFRNSGYSITRDKNNANVVVVPDINPQKYYKYECDLVAYNDDEKSIYLINVRKEGYTFDQKLTEKELTVARNYIKNSMILDVDDTKHHDLDVWFLPKCEEIVNIMTDNVLNVPYVQESALPINASTKISPETLVFWENINDENLLMRTICTSDWSKYPCTVLALLAGFRHDNNWFNRATGDFRRILNSIGYDYWNTGDRDFLSGRMISKEDYAMLQSYVYYKLGVGENGGFAPMKQWNKIPKCVRNIMQRKIALKPFVLPAKMKFDDLKSMSEV